MKMLECLGYTGENCINCGRLRVEKWSNGLRICEKCNYDQDKKEYSTEINDYFKEKLEKEYLDSYKGLI